MIRAIEPLEGIKFMLENRPVEKITNLTNGPGKLCQALAITRALDGIYLCDEDVEVTLHYGKNIDSAHTITETPRVGITKNVDDLLRFHIKDNEFVSK